jgi:hypothetical protein
MANTITNIMPKILARGLLALREQAIMPRVVNGDYSNEARRKGETIDVPIASETSAYDITPAPTQSSAPNSAPSLVQIPLDNWKGAGFFLTDNEMVQIDRNRHFIPLQMSEAIRSLANVINVNVHSNYTGIYGYTGTASTTPFASTVTDATNARKVLHQQRAPRTERRGVLDYDAEANALALSPFSDADKIGTSDIRIEGEVGRKYGIDWYADDAVQTHTAGTLAVPGGVVGSTTAAGATSIDLKSASAAGNALIGDVFTIAGQSQTYVVAATVSAIGSATSKAVTFQPPLTSIATAAAAVTFKASHVVNLAFHRDAFALAMRPLMGSTATNPLMMSVSDPQTGITLRLELTRQYKQDRWEFDVLWGSKLVRAALATRIAG